MSLQLLWAFLQDQPALALNSLALFFAVSGAWLWLATQWREYRAARLQGLVEARGLVFKIDADIERLNRFFYLFGALALLLALLCTGVSTRW